MNGRALATWTSLVFVAWVGVVGCEALVVSPAWSSAVVASIQMLFSMAATLLTVIGTIVAVLAIRQAKGRALALLGTCITAGIGGVHFENAVRMTGFHKCGDRLRPVVIAIRDYESRHGYPPASLADAGLPAAEQVSCLGAYPRVAYEVRPADRAPFGNRWMLRVETFSSDGFDQFIFLPNGNYPKMGFGGSIERLGKWAYVHD